MTRINTPKEVLALAGSSAADKLQNTAGKTLILAFLAGAYIAIGGLFSLMAGFVIFSKKTTTYKIIFLKNFLL